MRFFTVVVLALTGFVAASPGLEARQAAPCTLDAFTCVVTVLRGLPAQSVPPECKNANAINFEACAAALLFLPSNLLPADSGCRTCFCDVIPPGDALPGTCPT